MEENTNSLLQGPVSENLLKFAIPFIFAAFLQALYGAADLFVVGQFATTADVSAVATGSQVMQTLTSVFLGLSTGGTIMLSRYLGEKNYEKATRSVGSICFFSIILILIVTPLMALLTNQIVKIVNTPSEAVELSKWYIFICSLGIPFIIGYNLLASIIKGTGDSKTPVIFVLIACIINIGLDFLFVLPLGLNTIGAALATVISQAIAFGFEVIYILKHKFVFRFSIKDIKLDKQILFEEIKIGLPLSIQDGLVGISFIFIQSMVNTLGLVSSSAVGVVEKVLTFVFLIPSSFSQAMSVICALNIGAKNERRSEQTLFWAVIFSLIITTLFTVFTQINPYFLPAIFEKNPDVLNEASLYIKSYIIDSMVVAFMFNINGYLASNKKSYIPFAYGITATFLIRIPLSYLFINQGYSLYILGFASPIASMFSTIIGLIFVILINNKNKKTALKKVEV